MKLPISQIEAELKKFMPHGVAAAANEAMFPEGVNASSVQATKEDLLREFGPKTIRELDNLPEGEHEKRLEELRQKYAENRLKDQKVKLQDVNRSNLIKVRGMLVKLDGKEPTDDAINDLPEEDFQGLLQEIANIADSETAKKKPKRHDG